MSPKEPRIIKQHDAIHDTRYTIPDMIRATPGDCLPEGTKVIIEGKGNGVVKKSKMVQSSNNAGPISLHTIEYQDGKINDCNYAFIIVQCSMCNKPAERYQMHQPVCDKCTGRIASIHAAITKNNINDHDN